MQLDQLPKDWKWVKLDEVCDKISLNKIKIKQKEYLEKSLYPVVDQGQELIGGYYDDGKLMIPGEPPFIVFGDHTKIKKFINFRFIAGADGVKVIKAKKIINSKFLYYSLFTIKIEDKGYARHFQLLEKELFPLPPLPAQEAIVSKIEELFSELDKGIENLRLAQEQLKVYRQSVLKWAFEGKLTDNKVKQATLPKDWIIQKLGEVCEIKRGKSKHRPRNEPSLYGGKYPFIQTGDIRSAGGGYITQYSQTYNDVGLQQSKLWPTGTLCLTIAANIGETAILNFDACFPDSIVGLLSNEKRLLMKYTNYFFVFFKERLGKLAPATAQKNINVQILENINIPLAPINEQQKIIEEIERRLSVADKMDENICQSFQQAEGLRQSILKKAFDGKLTLCN